MGNEYMKYPATRKNMADEIKKACDNYFSRKITNDELTEILYWYANNCPEQLFDGPAELNSTISLLIGKKRIKLISKILDQYMPEKKEE